MANPFKSIRDAIVTRIQANWTATTIHWANTKILSPVTAPFIQPRVIFHTMDQVELGPNGHNRIVGELHCNIIYPAGQGEDEILTRVDAFCALFPRGYILPTAAESVTFRAPHAEEQIEVEDTFEVPVVCPFWMDAAP